MFPPMRQRLLIALTMALGVMAYMFTLPMLRPADHAGGISFLEGNSTWIVRALALLAAGGALAAVAGTVASASGNLLSGIFGLAIAMTVLAIAGGPIDGWMNRHAGAGNLLTAYGYLVVEVVILQALWLVALMAIQQFRAPLRAKFPVLALHDHLGADARMRFPDAQAILAGLTSAVVAGAISYVLLRNSGPGQVVGSLIIAFTLGATMGQLLFRQTNPVGILMAPALVATVGYIWVSMGYRDGNEVLAQWYAGQLPGPALALPIYYLSAGVAGCTIGIGWAQGLVVGMVQTATHDSSTDISSSA